MQAWTERPMYSLVCSLLSLAIGIVASVYTASLIITRLVNQNTQYLASTDSASWTSLVLCSLGCFLMFMFGRSITSSNTNNSCVWLLERFSTPISSMLTLTGSLALAWLLMVNKELWPIDQLFTAFAIILFYIVAVSTLQSMITAVWYDGAGRRSIQLMNDAESLLTQNSNEHSHH